MGKPVCFLLLRKKLYGRYKFDAQLQELQADKEVSCPLYKQQESVIMKQWHGKGGKGNTCNIYVLDKVLKLKHLELSVTIILSKNIKKQWKSQMNCKSR